ncbi:MAG TPA: MvdD family ATP-grasp ribosomal peptide maturase [Thermoanaerobaculia bacterium]|nr:MvdD family ATP-grasp ribosomal peptide maturase [Thermoanaerobaculia bacterium]
MTILLLTHTEDQWSPDRVRDALLAENADAVRVETDLFPSEIRLAAWHDGGGVRGMLHAGGRTIDLSTVSAVWHRRWNTAGQLSLRLSGDVLRGAERESEMSLEGVIAALPCFHLDDPSATERARNRTLQLQCAVEAGLDTPRTLTTNDPEAALRFYDECAGHVVVKMVSSFGVLDAEGHDQVVMTNRLTPEHLSKIDSLVLCPMTFQEQIEKALELRVTIVGHEVFAAAIDSSRDPKAGVDWRRATDALRSHWHPYLLPATVRDGLIALLDDLEMNYGAIDVIVTPEGRYVFLEVNPVGQFGWIEQSVGYPIASSIAGLLTGRLRRRVELPRRSGLTRSTSRTPEAPAHGVHRESR